MSATATTIKLENAIAIDGQTAILINTMVKNTKTKLTWKPSKHKVDLSKIDNPLSKPKHLLQNKDVTQSSNDILANKKYTNVLDFYKANNVTFNADMIPKFELIRLRDYLIPEEVQRLLDHPHMINILLKFDPRLLSPIYVVRLNGQVQMYVFDSMHTLTTVAVLAKEGLLGNDPNKWLDFEYPAWVIDTDDESFPMIAAKYRNGEGSKPWGPYDYHRVEVRSFDYYGNSGPDNKYKLAYQKQKTLEKENAIPLPENHPDLGKVGTLGHIKAVSNYSQNEMNEFDFVIQMNNKYWCGHNDSSMFGFYGNLYAGFVSVNQPVSGQSFDIFMDDLHAVIKTFFTSMPELKNTTTAAFKEWQKAQNKNATSPPHNCALALVLKLYKHLGGSHTVPSDVNMFIYAPAPNVKIDIYDYLPLSIRQDVNNYYI